LKLLITLNLVRVRGDAELYAHYWAIVSDVDCYNALFAKPPKLDAVM